MEVKTSQLICGYFYFLRGWITVNGSNVSIAPEPAKQQ